jgi:AcrR family transcriptional regulator
MGSPGTDTRTRIIDAAEELLGRYGPAKTNVVDVARALGMSHANVYRHFASKAELQDAVVERWLERVSAPLEAIVEAPGPAAERLVRWVRTLAEIKRRKVLDDPERFAAFHAAVEQARGVVDGHLATLRRQMAAIIQSGQASGELRAGDPEATAQAVLDATIRFHHPELVRAAAARNLDAQLAALLAILIAGLETGTGADAPGLDRAPRRLQGAGG